MSFLNRVKTGPKLIVSFMLLVVFVIIVAVIGHQNFKQIERQYGMNVCR